MQLPAARMLRYQSVASPHGMGTMKPPGVERTTTGVRNTRLERRPRCVITPYKGRKRVPASSRTTRLKTRLTLSTMVRGRGAAAAAVRDTDIRQVVLSE